MDGSPRINKNMFPNKSTIDLLESFFYTFEPTQRFGVSSSFFWVQRINEEKLLHTSLKKERRSIKSVKRNLSKTKSFFSGNQHFIYAFHSIVIINIPDNITFKLDYHKNILSTVYSLFKKK